jgi:hypothetical protein
MQAHVHVDAAASLIEAAYTGPVSFADRIVTIETVGSAITRNGGLKGVLLDYTNAWVGESAVGTFEKLSSRLQNASFLSGIHIALVNPAEFHAVPTEEIATRFGFTVRRFYSREAATAWLVQATTPSS